MLEIRERVTMRNNSRRLERMNGAFVGWKQAAGEVEILLEI